MYCGSINFTELQSREILNLLLLSDELIKLQSLVTYIQEILIKDHYNFIIENVIEITELTYQKKSLDKLWDFCLQQICDNPDYLFKSTKFLSINPSILEIILKRDDFCIDDEIDVWENLLKWACGQNPIIQQDINKWSKNEFTVMERRLSRFIPLIRFYHVSSEDFLLKVYPFKELLPNDLINNILAHHMAPNNRKNINIQPYRKPRYDSTLIKSQHFAIFDNWIVKKEYSRYITYDFNLLYRTNKDGNTAAAFHAKCDNKGATIVVAKIQNSEQVVGGYNPLDWNGNNWKSTGDSFLFSFTNRNNLKTAKVGRIMDACHENAVYCNQSYGPLFGRDYDLEIYSIGQTCYSYNDSYAKINIPQSFYVENYEVFQVIKK